MCWLSIPLIISFCSVVVEFIFLWGGTNKKNLGKRESNPSLFSSLTCSVRLVPAWFQSRVPDEGAVCEKEESPQEESGSRSQSRAGDRNSWGCVGWTLTTGTQEEAAQQPTWERLPAPPWTILGLPATVVSSHSPTSTKPGVDQRTSIVFCWSSWTSPSLV